MTEAQLIAALPTEFVPLMVMTHRSRLLVVAAEAVLSPKAFAERVATLQKVAPHATSPAQLNDWRRGWLERASKLVWC